MTTDTSPSNAGVMLGTGAFPMIGISQSTVEEWTQQVCADILIVLIYRVNSKLMAMKW
jgi:NAD(P)-dependent dehydrogenase (short-subunit alcohol dehydrogenase family)